MGKFECQHEPALVRWTVRKDELRVLKRDFGLNANGDVMCLRRDDVKDIRTGEIVGCVLVGIPKEQADLAVRVATQYGVAVETDITEPADPKKTRKKKGGK